MLQRIEKIYNQQTNSGSSRLSSYKKKALFAFVVFALCILIEPAYVSQATTGIHQIYRVAKYLTAAMILILFFLCRIRLNGLLLGVMFFEFMLLLPTIAAGSVYAWMQDGAYVIVLAMLVQIIVQIDARLFLNALSFVLGSYVHINTVCWLLYPHGMYVHQHSYWNCWFLGYDNIAFPIILMACMVSVYKITSGNFNGYLWDLSILISGTIFVALREITTGILAGGLFFGMIFLTHNKGMRGLIGKCKKSYVFAMIGMLLVIQFVSLNNALLSQIVELFGKSGSFSSRIRLWHMAWRDLFDWGFLFGRGVSTGAELASHFGEIWMVHVHCYYLQVLYEGGIAALVCFLILLLNVVSRYDKTEKKWSSTVFLITLFTFMLSWQVEAYDALTRYAVLVLALLYNTPNIEHSLSAASRKRTRRKRIRFVIGSRNALPQKTI